jgi:hypothetical protein
MLTSSSSRVAAFVRRLSVAVAMVCGVVASPMVMAGSPVGTVIVLPKPADASVVPPFESWVADRSELAGGPNEMEFGASLVIDDQGGVIDASASLTLEIVSQEGGEVTLLGPRRLAFFGTGEVVLLPRVQGVPASGT